MSMEDENLFQDKVLMITGGTGSFGTTVLRHFLDSGVREIRIFSRDEKKQDDMRRKYKCDRIKYYIGDIRDRDSLADAVPGTDFIFHAAAIKEVPSAEFFPMEAVKTNVIGTDNVLTAAIKYGVKKVICLSTDKASYPINAMGITKSLMEHIVIAKSRNVDPNKTLMCCTRYGNVMASRGSVIPLFIKQIKMGEPLTVTEGKMTRFMMNLDEAVDLVTYAFKNAQQGDIMIQKSPAATIDTLAQAIQELFGVKEPIQHIGMRHAEKMAETLMMKEESLRATDLGHYYRIAPDTRDLNYEKYVEKGELDVSKMKDYTSDNTERLNVEQMKEKLLTTTYVQRELAKWREEHK